MVAKLADGYTIEEHYQLRIKGHGVLGVDHWKVGKGKPALDSSIDLYEEYKDLWRQWERVYPDDFRDLRVLACQHNMLLTDMFATGPVSQARALAELLNEIPF